MKKLAAICYLLFTVTVMADVFPASDWFGTNVMKRTNAADVKVALEITTDSLIGLDFGATNQWRTDATNTANSLGAAVTNLINARSTSISNGLTSLGSQQASYLVKTNPIVSGKVWAPAVQLSNSTPASEWSVGVSNQFFVITNVYTGKGVSIDTNGVLSGNLASTDTATLTNIVNGLTIPVSEITNAFLGKTNPVVTGTMTVNPIVVSNGATDGKWVIGMKTNALVITNTYTGLGLTITTNGNTGTDNQAVTNIINGLTVPLSEITNAFVTYLFGTNWPPASAAVGGQMFLWNSNANKSYLLKSGPFSTTWTSTNELW